MPTTCCAYNCRSGYNTGETPGHVGFHRLPLEDIDLLREWLRNIRREDFNPTEGTRICSLHFTDDDFRNGGKFEATNRKTRRRLKPNAVPTIFNYPDGKKPPRPSPFISPQMEIESERLKEWDEQRERENKDRLKNLEDLKSRIGELSREFTPVEAAGSLYLNLIEVDTHEIPHLRVAVRLDSSLIFSVSYLGSPLKKIQFYNVSPGKKIQRFSQLLCVLEAVKQWSLNQKGKSWLEMSGECLERMKEEGIEDDTIWSKVNFLQEQLSLVAKPNRMMRYSPDLLRFAFSIYETNPEMYRYLQATKLVSLPCEGKLVKERKESFRQNVAAAAIEENEEEEEFVSLDDFCYD